MEESNSIINSKEPVYNFLPPEPKGKGKKEKHSKKKKKKRNQLPNWMFQ